MCVNAKLPSVNEPYLWGTRLYGRLSENQAQMKCLQLKNPSYFILKSALIQFLKAFLTFRNSTSSFHFLRPYSCLIKLLDDYLFSFRFSINHFHIVYSKSLIDHRLAKYIIYFQRQLPPPFWLSVSVNQNWLSLPVLRKHCINKCRINLSTYCQVVFVSVMR